MRPKTYGLTHKGKRTPKVPQLVIKLQNRPPTTCYSLQNQLVIVYQIYDIPQLTKPFILSRSVVLTLLLSDMAAESTWDTHGPHMSIFHVITLSLSPPFPSSSLFVSYFSPL